MLSRGHAAQSDCTSRLRHQHCPFGALVFPGGRLSWLRGHWRDRQSVPLVSRATAAELSRVFAYPKFRLAQEDREELLGEYLPWCEIVEVRQNCPVLCRDPKDPIFLDLAQAGKATVIVTGDRDLLSLAGSGAFAIESPEAYRSRASETLSRYRK